MGKQGPRPEVLSDPESNLWARRPSRGGFVKTLAAAALAGTSLPALADSVRAGASRQQLDKELNFYNWAAWVGPTTVSRFAKKYGVTVRQDFYDSNDTMYAKLKAGGLSLYDVIVPTGYEITTMIDQQMLKPLNYANIPNAKYLAPAFQHLSFDPGNVHSIPNDWGAVGIAYRTDMVSESITSWADVWRLAPKYHHKITFLATPRDVLGVGLLMNGYSVSTTKASEIQKARDTILKIKPHILEITSTDQRASLLRGDAAIIMDWNEEIPTAQADKKHGKYVKWVNPSEGLVGYIDELAIPAGAPHPYTAEVFINWLLDPANYAEFVNYDTTAFTMKNSPLIQKSILTSPIINPSAEVLKRLHMQYNVGKANALYLRAWTEFKAS